MVKGKGFRSKLGDTLVEVSIAIGIFSMVAIAAVMVINASTSSTQAILENTITRDEIDAQAEALRFIQSAFAAGGEVNPAEPATKYGKIWAEFSKNAIDLSTASEAVRNAIAVYNPSTCSELYDTKNAASIIGQKAFAINTHALGSNDVNDILIKPVSADNMGVFKEAKTYPRIVYNKTAGSDSMYNQNEASSVLSGDNFDVNAVEGLFVVAVRDSDGTIVVSGDGKGVIETKSAYIDFYVRSCWFAPSADRPSTISTVIRLYDPSNVSVNKYKKGGVIINYQPGDGIVGGTMPSQYIVSGTTARLLDNQYTREGYAFDGWMDQSGHKYTPTGSFSYTAPAGKDNYETVTLTAQWKQYKITINYQSGDCPTSVSGVMNPVILYSGATFTLPNSQFSCANHRFAKWEADINGETKTFTPGDLYVPHSPDFTDITTTFKATWTPIYTIIYNSDVSPHECDKTTGCTLSSERPTRQGYTFEGWCTVETSSSSCSGTTYQPGGAFPGSAISTYDTYLYAIWKYDIKRVNLVTTWTHFNNEFINYRCDYDTYLVAQDNSFIVYYNNRSYNYTLNGNHYSIKLNQDGGYSGASPNETYELNRLDGKNFYFYVKIPNNYFCRTVSLNNLQVEVQAINESGNIEASMDTFTPSDTLCDNYWNVFAYKNGELIRRDTCSFHPETSY